MNAELVVTLDDTIKRYEDVTMNAIAVEAKIRPGTVSDLCAGRSKAIKFETLQAIVNALNTLTNERHTIEDVIAIEYR